MVVASNQIVETYSRLAEQYDDDANIHSCWGKATGKALRTVIIKDSYRVVLDVGCGTGRGLVGLASKSSPDVRWIGIDPAENMRKLAIARTRSFPNVQILDGSFEAIPLESCSVDYLFSIFAFHWTTNVEVSVRELKRVLKPSGEMDLFFIGRDNGREFIQATTPIFLKHMGPALLLESARMRKQLTRKAAFRHFSQEFPALSLSVDESYDTYYDTLEGHWGWWVRIEGQFMQIPAVRKAACDQEIRDRVLGLEGKNGIPYTLHQLQVKLRCKPPR